MKIQMSSSLQKKQLYRKTSCHGAHEKLFRADSAGSDKAKDWVWLLFAQLPWEYSLYYRILAEGRYIRSEKTRHRLPGRRRRKWKGQGWLQLLACAGQYLHFQSCSGETAAKLWNSLFSTELMLSQKKLLGPSLYFGLSLGTQTGS